MMTIESVSSRLVKIDLEEHPSKWTDVIPEHSSDLLQWASALKVGSINRLTLRLFKLHKTLCLSSRTAQNCMRISSQLYRETPLWCAT